MGYILLHAGIDTRAKSAGWIQFEASLTGIFLCPQLEYTPAGL
jgi:hypothetical protein